jgi:hypothetical protein
MENLINEDGRPAFGIHQEPFKELNIRDFRPHGQRNKPLFTGHKRWIFLGVSNKDVIFGLAVVHLGYLANLFAYVFDRKQKKLMAERDIIVPSGFGVDFSGSSLQGSAAFKSGGVTAGIVINPNMLKLDADLGAGFSVNLVYSRLKEPLNAVTRNGLKGFNFTNKEAGLSVQGKLKAGGIEYSADPLDASGGFDYTFGVLKRQTFWNWASGGGIDSSGRKLGFNFAAGVNETGFTENAFWVDGKMIKVDTVDFKYDDLNMLSRWDIRSSDGRVNLLFTPEGERAKNLNIGLIKSYYHQPFGTFSGTLSNGAETYALKEVYGFTEEHEAVW